jgi:hypothetical protein
MYKQASRLKLRFNTEKGVLSVEQLWDCSRAMLGREIKKLHSVLAEQSGDADELSFLAEGTIVDTVDPELKLQFDILKDVFITKKTEAQELRDAEEVKRHNAKIDAIIARKQDETLESMSIEDLEKQRK